MNWEALSAIGSFLSAAVIAATAIVAVIQIRQLRASNQLEGFIELFRELEAPDMVAAEEFIEGDLPERLQDPKFRQELISGQFIPSRHPELVIGSFWERTGALIRHGVLDKELFLDYAGDVCPRHWQLLGDVAKLRRQREPLIWEQFENLVILCERYREMRRHGAPPTVRVKARA